MGLYITVIDNQGNRLGWMEVYRDDDIRPTDEFGEYTYHFRYNGGKGRGTVGGEGVRHERRKDVWELVREILNHSEAQPEYCGLGACQFRPVDDPELIEGYLGKLPLYRKVEAATEA
jgi:hypothetical protein